MFSISRLASVLAIAFPLFLTVAVFAIDVDDDDTPEVTGRVARISYMSGDVQVRHSGQQDWEKAVLNLPVVEGDELTTSDDARFEIEFNAQLFVRVDSTSYLRIVTLKDEGIALSFPEGSMSIRVNEFNKDHSFFEIDIPRTTIAIQKAGLYRIDPGTRDSVDARIRVTDGGEARIYSGNSGFTLKNDRFATVHLTGDHADEWETADASPFSDAFDTWTLDRDSIVAKRLKDAYYDKYYDRDIVGAEDLNDYGEWVYTRSYGYVWKPFSSSLAGYTDWSPYRYGHWRWIPYFGWTWVNDEPWGWATYHYGRWVWDDGYWYWTPYAYYHPHRSWWQPALVVITTINNNICWYPLPYRYHYYNYNHDAYERAKGRHEPIRNPTVGSGTGITPTPTPGRGGVGLTNEQRRQRELTPPLLWVPPGSVVTIPTDQFGRGLDSIQKAPLTVAHTILSKAPDESRTPTIALPTREQVASKLSKNIVVEAPPVNRVDRTINTGVATRSEGRPMDEQLRKTLILGNRDSIKPRTTSDTEPVGGDATKPRDTGAVTRPAKSLVETPAVETPPYVPPTRTVERKVDPPAPIRTEERKVEPAQQKPEQPRKETPRSEPTVKNETPPYVAPRRDPPSTPKPEPKSEPKSEPKTEPKPDKPSASPDRSGSAKKSGR